MAITTPRVSYEQLIKQHLKILKNLQFQSGLFLASDKAVETGYDKSWLRDNFYECLAFAIIGDWTTVEHTYHALLSIFLKHESKIDEAIKQKPTASFEYIHARYHPETFNEYWEDWGNKQNDSIGAILYMIGELEHHHHKSILDSGDKVRVVQKLVWYLGSIEYWHDPDSGMWEEGEEVHASSVGACLAGLKSIARLPRLEVPPDLITQGQASLNILLPRESAQKFVDLSLLSLIYPYEVVTDHQRSVILENVEYHLVRQKGVIRYKNDQYYNKNPDSVSEEAEWTFGLSWLALIYITLGNRAKAENYITRMLQATTDKGVPELFFSNSKKHNENNPLGWSESLFIVALYEMNLKYLEPATTIESQLKNQIVDSLYQAD